ncbi:MAG: hypothetical protein HZC28_07840 [Spirochaetes bacterium]|nr:hypothetical protein [Spirochaetota bacterium]
MVQGTASPDTTAVYLKVGTGAYAKARLTGGVWKSSVGLTQGRNVVSVYAQNAAGVRGPEQSITILYGTTAAAATTDGGLIQVDGGTATPAPTAVVPDVSFVTEDKTVVTSSAVMISGTAVNAAAVYVKSGNGAFQKVKVEADGKWSVAMALAEGDNIISAYAEDAAKKASAAKAITVTCQVPVEFAFAPVTGSVEAPLYTLKGVSKNAVKVLLKIGTGATIEVKPAADGSWSGTVALAAGDNVVRAIAVTAGGMKSAEQNIVVTHVPAPAVNIDGRTFIISGTITGGTASSVFASVNGGQFITATGTTSWSIAVPLSDGPNKVDVYTKSAAGTITLVKSLQIVMAGTAGGKPEIIEKPGQGQGQGSSHGQGHGYGTIRLK